MPHVKTPVQEGGRAEDLWKHEPIFVMDGGTYFFTAQFDGRVGRSMRWDSMATRELDS
jgi:hypothetical protein